MTHDTKNTPTPKESYFITVFPPEGISQHYAHLPRHHPDWRWCYPQHYHVSLAYCGCLTEREVKKIKTLLEDMRNFTAFYTSFRGLDIFPVKKHFKSHRQGVLYAIPDGHGDAQLSSLSKHIKTILRRAKFRTGRSDATMHMTLARMPKDDTHLAQKFARAHNHIATGKFLVDSFALVRTLPPSHADHPVNNNGEGSKYITYQRFPLKPCVT